MKGRYGYRENVVIHFDGCVCNFHRNEDNIICNLQRLVAGTREYNSHQKRDNIRVIRIIIVSRNIEHSVVSKSFDFGTKPNANRSSNQRLGLIYLKFFMQGVTELFD